MNGGRAEWLRIGMLDSVCLGSPTRLLFDFTSLDLSFFICQMVISRVPTPIGLTV